MSTQQSEAAQLHNGGVGSMSTLPSVFVIRPFAPRNFPIRKFVKRLEEDRA
jgi:hypothetical protein